jgi:hypothetical protein
MTLDRWRGRRGLLGYLVRRWDVWQIRIMLAIANRIAKKIK